MKKKYDWQRREIRGKMWKENHVVFRIISLCLKNAIHQLTNRRKLLADPPHYKKKSPMKYETEFFKDFITVMCNNYN